ncbi:MAG: hypothetical protein ACHQQQ_05020 [Bacteroidota bacterium]
MKHIFSIFAVFTLFSAILYAADIEKEITVKSGEKLEMDLRTGGAIIVTGWDEEKVSVQVDLNGRDAKYTHVDIEKVSSGVSIVSDYERRRRSSSSNLEFRIKVPQKFDLELNTMGGEIRLENIEGTINGNTMGGELNLTHLKGAIDLKTMGGSITLTKSDVDGEVKTNGGTVLLRDVTGNVSGHSMGGSVTYDNVSDRAGKSTGKEVNISTMGGEINVDHAPFGANVNTMGGDISIHSVQKYVKAKTMGGNIEIDTIDGSINAQTMGGNVTATMVGDPVQGNRDVYISSKGGDITLVVPDALSMDVDISLAYTKNNDRWSEGAIPKIISDFDLKKDETDTWERDHGSARKYIYGKGTIAGGKNKIHIETINGDVHLKKASKSQ